MSEQIPTCRLVHHLPPPLFLVVVYANLLFALLAALVIQTLNRPLPSKLPIALPLRAPSSKLPSSLRAPLPKPAIRRLDLLKTTPSSTLHLAISEALTAPSARLCLRHCPTAPAISDFCQLTVLALISLHTTPPNLPLSAILTLQS